MSAVGGALTTAVAILFIVSFLADLSGLHSNPYFGIVLFLLLPGLFVVGLLLIPLGAAIERWRRRRGKAPTNWPRIDLNDPVHRQRTGMAIALTVVNVVIVSLAAYGGVEYMETPSFCGQVCHVAMKPEFVAHQWSSHARVACTSCHIGKGATSAAGAKLAGVRRMIATVRDNHPRPIPPPRENAVPARETCEQCHWPEHRHGDRIRRIVEHAGDEANSESVTTLVMHVGGGSARLGGTSGIHWHMNVANQIDFVSTDAARETIPSVRLTAADGTVREYRTPGVTDEQLAAGVRRRMDCMDCHNRPSHPIAASAARAVDEALTEGALPKLPFIKREAVSALEGAHGDEASALAGIARVLGDFYKDRPRQDAQQGEIDRAIDAVRSLYLRNVFPEMKVTFGTYPSQIGHVSAPGCFRCHDGEHATKDGRTISQDCALCHTIE